VLKETRVRFLLVGGLCALVHNAIMIGGAALGLHYVVSTLISYVVVVLLGFFLHSHFTFSVGPELRSFAKYALGMSLNYPFWLVLMFVFCNVGRLPMIIASPLGTCVMVLWNFAVSRWAILKRAPEPASARQGEAP
jgi:putative flippase GtrA